MGFGFEAINTAQTREVVMKQIIGYFDGSIILGVKNGFPSDLPVTFKLEQNYHNPFNSTTTIRFELPVQSRVSLKIYNLLGQVVKVLKDGNEQPGVKSFEWNATGLPSGVYFYKLGAVDRSSPSKTFEQIRKAILLE